MAAADLPDAIEQSWAASALAGEGVLAGLYFDQAADGAVPPYAVFREKSTRAEYRSSTVDVYEVTLEFRVVAAEVDLAAGLGERLNDEWLCPPTSAGLIFAFSNGKTTPLVREGEPRRGREKDRGRLGRNPWNHAQDYCCRVIRSKV